MAARTQASRGRNYRQMNRQAAVSYRDGYVHGSAAPKLEPAYEPDKRQPRRKPKNANSVRSNQRIRRNQEKALHMDLPYVIMLTVASLCTLYLCVNYLHLQSSITGRMHAIERMEADLEKQRSENDALETAINTSVDLNQIYEIATMELGMVYANKNQVLLFDKSESEYVRQYEDIPEY